MQNTISPEALFEKIKSFGPFGPQYEVGPVLFPLAENDWMVHITLVGTGETAQYPWTRILNDPDAA